MATIQHAERKLEKWAGTVSASSSPAFKLVAEKSGVVIEVGGRDEADLIRVRQSSERDDARTDYCAGTWCDTVAAAIRMADRIAG